MQTIVKWLNDAGRGFALFS